MSNQTQRAVVIDSREGIKMFRLSAVLTAVRFYNRTGLKMARNMPTVARLRSEYGITARTYAQAEAQLLDLRAECEAGTLDPMALPG